jgi:hypothetical protein
MVPASGIDLLIHRRRQDFSSRLISSILGGGFNIAFLSLGSGHDELDPAATAAGAYEPSRAISSASGSTRRPHARHHTTSRTPGGGLILDPDGHLYGLDYFGGNHREREVCSPSCGTVYEVTP